MRATQYEFRNRFWLIAACFSVAFMCYGIDKVNMANFLASLALRNHAPDAVLEKRVLQSVLGIGSLLCFAAAAIRSWGSAYLRPDVVYDSGLHSERLMKSGIYRYVRNPLYFGNILLAMGIGLMASRLGFVVLVVSMTIVVYRLSKLEESELLKSHSESYLAYQKAVPLLFPALRPRVPAEHAETNWGKALRGEFFMWACGIALAGVAITLKGWFFFAVVGASFLVFVVLNYISPHGKNTAPPSAATS